MKKLIALLLTLILCVSVFSVTAFADGETTASFAVTDKEDAQKGETVTLTVSLENNPGIAGMDITISYDETRLEKVSYEGVAFGGGVWTIDNHAIWDNGRDVTDNGDILTLTFKVKKDAFYGEAEVKVSAVAGNWAGEYVTITEGTGIVNIPAPHSCYHGDLVHFEEKESTCLEHGWIEHWQCPDPDCGKYYVKISENGYKETTWDQIVKPLADHKPGEEWLSDATGHWHICTVCEKVIDATKAEHDWNTEFGKDDTHHWLICGICEFTSEKEEHDFCIEGEDGYYYCECGQKGEKIPVEDPTEPSEEPTEKPTDPPKDDGKDDVPQTGDITMQVVMTGIIGFVAMLAVVIFGFKFKSVK